MRKNKGTIKCDKRIVICDVGTGTAQYEDETVKCEKKNKRFVKYDKRIVTCNIRIAQYEDETIKCDVLVT